MLGARIADLRSIKVSGLAPVPIKKCGHDGERASKCSPKIKGKGEMLQILKLTDKVVGERPAEPILPMAHVTDVNLLRTILAEGKLGVRVDGKPALHVFYGTSAYFPKIDGIGLEAARNGERSSVGQTITNPLERPVALVLRSDLAGLASCMYPFDSGGFSAHRYSMYLGKYSLDSFRFPVKDKYCPARIVKRYFGDNQHYIYGEAVGRQQLSLEEQPLRELYCSTGLNPFDERAMTIELQFDDVIPIKDAVEFIVLPRTIYELFLEQEVPALKSHELLFYEDFSRFGPEADAHVIRVKIVEYLREHYLGEE